MDRCPICLLTKPLVNDHCHATGYQRDRICAVCNSGLGMFKDNAQALRRAARYIELHRKMNRELSIEKHTRPSDLRPAAFTFAPVLRRRNRLKTQP